jgi:hypothetical protein
MRAGVLLCSILGHRWHVDETSTDSEGHLLCSRCGSRQLLPEDTAFGRRIAAEAGEDRAVGPFGGRR